MNLEDIQIKNKVTGDVRIEIFDTYAESYNECKNKMERINFASNLSILQTGYANQLELLNKRIENGLMALTSRLKEVKYGDYKRVIVDGGDPEPIFISNHNKDADLPKKIDHLIAILNDTVESLQSVYGTHSIKRVKAGFKGLFKEIKRPFRSNEPNFRLLQDALALANKHGTIKTHMDNLNTIIFEIGIRNYPPEIKVYGDRSRMEQEEIKQGRPFSKPEIKKQVEEYYQKNIESLEKEETEAAMVDSILDSLDDELGISKVYKDPSRTIKYWLNGY